MSVLYNWGMRCPKCKSSDSLDIQALVWIRLTEDGTDADASGDGSHHWEDGSSCVCRNCGWKGTAKETQI